MSETDATRIGPMALTVSELKWVKNIPSQLSSMLDDDLQRRRPQAVWHAALAIEKFGAALASNVASQNHDIPVLHGPEDEEDSNVDTIDDEPDSGSVGVREQSIKIYIDNTYNPRKIAEIASLVAHKLEAFDVTIKSCNQEKTVSLAESADNLTKLFFVNFIENCAKNLRAVIRSAGNINQFAETGAFVAKDDAPKELKGLIFNIGQIITASHPTEVEALRLNLFRADIIKNYQSLLRAMDAKSSNPAKSYLIRAYENLGERRGKGKSNATVIKTVIANIVNVPIAQITSWMKDAQLPFILSDVWGSGALMFMPSGKTNHRSMVAYYSAFRQVIDIVAQFDEGMFSRLAGIRSNTIVSRIENMEPLRISGGTKALTQSLSIQTLLNMAGAHSQGDANEDEQDNEEQMDYDVEG